MNILMKLAVTSGLIGLVIMLIACILGMVTVGMATPQAIAITGIILGLILVALSTSLGALSAIVYVWSH